MHTCLLVLLLLLLLLLEQKLLLHCIQRSSCCRVCHLQLLEVLPHAGCLQPLAGLHEIVHGFKQPPGSLQCNIAVTAAAEASVVT
jgi:hypothetical protein